MARCYDEYPEVCPCLNVSPNWGPSNYRKALSYLKTLGDRPVCRRADLDWLRNFLRKKRPFVLQLLVNPNILEHERGSNLIWSILFLTEELEARSNIPDKDPQYFAESIRRVFQLLGAEWLTYVQFLKENHPFLFSLILESNPFQARPVSFETGE